MGPGRILIVLGLMLAGVGLLVEYGGRLPFRLGHLPGDIAYRGRNASFYFPITTCIVLSIIFSLILRFIRR